MLRKKWVKLYSSQPSAHICACFFKVISLKRLKLPKSCFNTNLFFFNFGSGYQQFHAFPFLRQIKQTCMAFKVPQRGELFSIFYCRLPLTYVVMCAKYLQISLYNNRCGNNMFHHVSCQANLFNKANRFATSSYLLFFNIISDIEKTNWIQDYMFRLTAFFLADSASKFSICNPLHNLTRLNSNVSNP